MGNDLRLNFISATLLTLLSIAILIGSVAIHTRVDEPLYASPALMPGILGAALLLCSLLLLWQSVRGGGWRTRAAEAGAWIAGVAKHPDTRTTLIGLALMAIYTFVLVPLLPFWIATVLFTTAMLAFLRATRWYWVLLISAATAGGIVLLFETAFNIPLP